MYDGEMLSGDTKESVSVGAAGKAAPPPRSPPPSRLPTPASALPLGVTAGARGPGQSGPAPAELLEVRPESPSVTLALDRETQASVPPARHRLGQTPPATPGPVRTRAAPPPPRVRCGEGDRDSGRRWGSLGPWEDRRRSHVSTEARLGLGDTGGHPRRVASLQQACAGERGDPHRSHHEADAAGQTEQDGAAHPALVLDLESPRDFWSCCYFKHT